MRMLVRLNIMLIVMIFVAVSASGAVESFLVNGDFEEGTDGDVPGWSRSFYPRRDDNIGDCIRRSDAQARSGRWSLKIDTEPVLGEEVTLVFNGAVSQEIMNLRGKHLILSGWIYVEPGTALRPIGMRLRTFGTDQKGESVFLADVLSVKVVGKPGEWVPFQASGTLADADIASMDLHCAIRPDAVRTVQFLDHLRLEHSSPPPLEVRLLRNAVWRDEPVLAVKVRLNNEEAETIAFRLIDVGGKVVAQWERQARTAILGLFLPETPFPEGRYLLRSELRDGSGKVLASAEAPLEVEVSPWEGAQRPLRRTSGHTGDVPEGFQVVGTVAPTDAPDVVPAQPEMISPDVGLSEWREGNYTMSSWRERGYAVFSRHYLDEVYRLGRPRPGEFGPLRLFACPGEYEPATLSVWAMRPQKEVRVTVTDLEGAGIISSSNVDVRVVRTIEGLPPFLEKRTAVDIPKDQTQTFWLTVRVPPDAAPGFYVGDVSISAKDSEPTLVELLLRVLPLKLPSPPKGYGFWWKMDARWNGYYSKERDEALEQIRKQFVLLREHGCNMVACYGMPKMTKTDDSAIVFDFEQDHWGHNKYSLADFFRLGRETGLFSPEVPLQYVGADSLHTHWIARFTGLDLDSAAFDDFYRDACRRVDKWAKEQGFTLAFACIDEIGNSAERRQNALRFYRIAGEAGVLTSVTDNSMHGGVHLMGQSRFDDIIAMRLYNFITPEMMEHTRKSGDVLWLYNMGSGGWDAKRDRFVFGLFTERCGAAGYSQWAFQWPSGNVDPYEAAAAGQRSGYHYALPAPDGPLPTLALEGVREGIDDARYLALFRQRFPESQAASLDDIEPFSTRIEEYLSGHSGGLFDIRRWRMAREVMEAE